jgi:hypothetical protein
LSLSKLGSLLVGLAALVLIGLAAVTLAPHHSTAAGRIHDSSPLITPASPRSLGVMADPWHVDDYEHALKTRLQIVENFMPWGERRLPARRLAELERRGLTPLISWLPRDVTSRANPHAFQAAFSNSAIAAGAQDGYIRSFARTLASFRGTVLMRYAPEFDGRWEPWHWNAPAYVEAWQRIHRIFREEGASNVKFVWSPNLPWLGYNGGDDGWLRRVRSYWPGAAYVDYVGTTTVSHNGQGVSFFARRVPLLRVFGKPVVLGEVYAPEPLRADWLPDFARMVNGMPWVKAVVWCDLNPKRPITDSPARSAWQTITHDD